MLHKDLKTTMKHNGNIMTLKILIEYSKVNVKIFQYPIAGELIIR